MSAIARLGPFVSKGCATDDATLRQRVVHAFVDTIGCMSVGVRAETVQGLCRAFEPIAPGTAPVFGTPVKLSPAMAALVNGASAHAWDLDDWEDMGNTHPSAALVPAILAAANLRRCSGERALSAYATGFEVIARLGTMATSGHYQAGFHVTGTLGALGAAAAVAHLMRLDAEQSGHAVALAASQAMGLTAQFGSDAKALQAGLAAKAGLLSAQMAAAGLRGKETVLDAPRGFFAALCPGWESDASHLDRLGDPPALLEGGIYVKRHPSCAYTHRLISCAETIARTPEFAAEAITEVTAILPDFHHAILPYAEPQTRTEALFSLEFCISQTLLGRGVSLGALERAAWRDADGRALRQRMTVRPEPARNPHMPIDPEQPDRLLVTCGDATFAAECAWPEGAPARSLGADGIAAKFPDLPVDALSGWTDAADVAEYVARVC
ncbi:MAG: MmgE/PrpD family protein [Paracoccaceae bacterium]